MESLPRRTICSWHCLTVHYPSLSKSIFPSLLALIVHEGPSVFRIFNRWQAVNQQWKVLNYDKVKDNEEHQKTGASFRNFSLPLTNRMGPTGTEGEASTSTSSLMAAAVAAAAGTATPTTNSVPLAAGATTEPQDSFEPSNGQPSLPDHHCAYNILHLLSHHLRPQEPRGQTSNSNRELVMRVTTVWGLPWGLVYSWISACDVFTRKDSLRRIKLLPEDPVQCCPGLRHLFFYFLQYWIKQGSSFSHNGYKKGYGHSVSNVSNWERSKVSGVASLSVCACV